uniref:Uncharacterized protein n=1 Tax=Romanomermis culicivorax TaxID=13658 RepID=A0A915L3P9_ROMCU
MDMMENYIGVKKKKYSRDYKLSAISEAEKNGNRPTATHLRIDEKRVNVKLPLKVIASVRPQTELFLNAANDNILEEIPEEERVSFYDDKSDVFSQPEEIEAE